MIERNVCNELIAYRNVHIIELKEFVQSIFAHHQLLLYFDLTLDQRIYQLIGFPFVNFTHQTNCSRFKFAAKQFHNKSQSIAVDKVQCMPHHAAAYKLNIVEQDANAI